MKNFDEIKKDAEILVDTEMEVIKGGATNQMASADSCAACCMSSNGGIQQPTKSL